MSAIVGFLHRTGAPAEMGELRRVIQPLKRWGPDGTQTTVAGPVALAQLSLEVGDRPPAMDPSARAEPGGIGDVAASVSGSGSRLLAVADARLDDRVALGATLGWSKTRIDEASDHRLILGAYERWGPECPEHLLGDFALAIWDGERRSLFCARDPLGVRPFYYYVSDGLFAFGSQIGPLLALPGVPTRLNESTLGAYLAILPPDKDNTFYEGVSRLPPATTLEISADSLKSRRYWELDERREIRLGSNAEYAEAFRTVFREAVGARLGGPRIGVTLSGGLDSSSIVGVARELRSEKDPIVAISGTFPSFRSPTGKVDEKHFIDLVVEGGGVIPHFVSADRLNPIFDFLWQGEEPLPAGALYMDFALLRMAQELGVRAFLNGNDGDTVVGYGRTFLVELAWRLRWRTFFRELRALSRRYRVGRRALLAQWVFPTLVPGLVADRRARSRERDGVIYDTRSFIRRDFAQRVGVIERARELKRREKPSRWDREVHRAQIESSMLTLLLEVMARSAAQFSLEPRYPFLDRRLVEFCLALPGDQKLHDGWDRVVMRRAMEGILPREIQWRDSKQDLSLNLNVGLLAARDLMDRIILRQSSPLEPFVDLEALRGAYRSYLESPERGSRRAFSLFWATVFGLWLEHHQLSP